MNQSIWMMKQCQELVSCDERYTNRVSKKITKTVKEIRGNKKTIYIPAGTATHKEITNARD